MFLFISTLFEALQISNIFTITGDFIYNFVFTQFITPAKLGSWLDFILICFVTPINSIWSFTFFFTTAIFGSWLDFVLIFVAPISLIWVFLSGRGIGKIIRDTSVTLGGLGAAYQARLLAQNGESDRLRREAEAKAQEAEARRADEAKAAEAKSKALQNRIQELEADLAKAKT